MKRIHIGLLLIPFLFLGLLFVLPNKADAACPLDTDTKMNVDPITNQCFSNNDQLLNPGFNTTGGSRTCGPVQCPGSTAPYTRGNTCIVKKADGFCYAGKGPSGYDVPGCTPVPTHLSGCPKPMNLTIQAVDSTGKGIPGIRFFVTYEDAPPGNVQGKVATTSATITNGNVVLSNTLYSGDHYTITVDPSSVPAGYGVSPNQIGSNKIGDMEMNTISSCGTQLENGQSNAPCKFTLTATGNVNTVLPLPTPYPDTTVQDAETSSLQTLGFLVVVGAGAYTVSSLIGDDSKIKKR